MPLISNLVVKRYELVIEDLHKVHNISQLGVICLDCSWKNYAIQ